jgi:hypothetical protein
VGEPQPAASVPWPETQARGTPACAAEAVSAASRKAAIGELILNMISPRRRDAKCAAISLEECFQIINSTSKVVLHWKDKIETRMSFRFAGSVYATSDIPDVSQYDCDQKRILDPMRSGP